MAFISHFQENNQPLNGVYSCIAIHLCLLIAFLFMSGSTNRGPVVLSIVAEDCRDQTPMLLAMVETILCLNHVHHHPDQFF